MSLFLFRRVDQNIKKSGQNTKMYKNTYKNFYFKVIEVAVIIFFFFFLPRFRSADLISVFLVIQPIAEQDNEYKDRWKQYVERLDPDSKKTPKYKPQGRRNM